MLSIYKTSMFDFMFDQIKEKHFITLFHSYVFCSWKNIHDNRNFHVIK